MTKRGLVKGYFQDEDKGSEALARTQVYLSKTKLENTSGELACIYSKSTIGVVSHKWSKV